MHCIKCKNPLQMANNEHCVIQLTEHTAITQGTILYHFVSSNICNIQLFNITDVILCMTQETQTHTDPEFYNAKNFM